MKKQYLSLALALLFIGCGSDNTTTQTLQNDGKGDIDLAQYLPTTSMSKTFSTVDRFGIQPTDVTTGTYTEIITIDGNKTTTTKNGKITEISTITDTNITTLMINDDSNESKSIYRHADIGDTVFTFNRDLNETTEAGKIDTTIEGACKIESQEKSFIKGDHVYEGDLLKLKCTNSGTLTYNIKPELMALSQDLKDLNGTHDYYDTSEIYLKKDLGSVAEINDNCTQNSQIPILIDDRKSDCNKTYYYEFYLP